MSELALWQLKSSPPARAVMVLGDILGLKFEYKDVDFMNLEHKSPEYLKINPLGTFPTLKDGDFYLTDSHAIMKYLLSKYGGDQSERLYPRDVRTRALVDQALFFDTGVYFIQVKRVAGGKRKLRLYGEREWGQSTYGFYLGLELPTVYDGMKGVPENIVKDIEAAYSVVEAFLKGRPYLAGEQLTIADISVGLTTAAMQPIHKLDKDKYSRTAAWFDRLQEVEVFKNHSELTTKGLGAFLTACWVKNNA